MNDEQTRSLAELVKKLAVIDDMRVGQARIEERQTAAILRDEDLKRGLENLATKADLRIVDINITALDGRLEKVESFVTWVQRIGVSSIVLVVTGLAYLGKLIGVKT